MNLVLSCTKCEFILFVQLKHYFSVHVFYNKKNAKERRIQHLVAGIDIVRLE